MAEENDLVMELQEDARADAVAGAWRRYGNSIIVGAILIVLGTAAGVYWNHRQASLEAEQTSLFIAADLKAQQGDTEEAAKDFGRIASLHSDLYPLAALRQAQALKDLGDDQGVIDALQPLAQDNSADALMRTVAALWILRLADAKQQPDVVKALEAQVAATDQPLWPLGKEAAAVAQIERGKLDEAKKILREIITSKDAPNGVAQRAVMVLGTLE